MEVTNGITAGAVVALNPLTLISENEKRELFGVNGKSAGKKDWVGFAKAKDAEVAAGGATEPGKAAPVAAGKGGELAIARGGDPAKAKAKGRTKGAGGGGFGGPFAAKFQNIAPEDRQKMRTASPQERNEILKAPVSPMTSSSRCGRCAGGGGGRPGGGGGFGGGPPGGGGGRGPAGGGN